MIGESSGAGILHARAHTYAYASRNFQKLCRKHKYSFRHIRNLEIAQMYFICYNKHEITPYLTQ